jgi:hypothetical protein
MILNFHGSYYSMRALALSEGGHVTCKLARWANVSDDAHWLTSFQLTDFNFFVCLHVPLLYPALLLYGNIRDEGMYRTLELSDQPVAINDLTRSIGALAVLQSNGCRMPDGIIEISQDLPAMYTDFTSFHTYMVVLTFGFFKLESSPFRVEGVILPLSLFQVSDSLMNILTSQERCPSSTISPRRSSSSSVQ